MMNIDRKYHHEFTRGLRDGYQGKPDQVSIDHAPGGCLDGKCFMPYEDAYQHGYDKGVARRATH